MKKHIPTADIYPTVYSLCAIHAARNAGIFTANHRSLVVQWAKTGNDEDNTLKLKQMQESKMTENQINHMLAASENVTYIGLAATQNLITNFEVEVISNHHYDEIVSDTPFHVLFFNGPGNK